MVALAEGRDRLRERVAARHGIEGTCETPADLLEGSAADAVATIDPFERHGLRCPPIPDRELPLLAERALAVRVELGKRLVPIAEANDAVHAPETVAEWHDTGAVGALEHVRIVTGRRLAGRRARADHDRRADPRDDGVAEAYVELVNVYSHRRNRLRALLGDCGVTRADRDGHTLVAEARNGATGVLGMEPCATIRG